MRTKLREIGTSKGVIIPSTIIKLMNIDPKNGLIELDYNGGEIIIRKAEIIKETNRKIS